MTQFTCIPSKQTVHKIADNYLNGFTQLKGRKDWDVIKAVAKIATYIILGLPALILWYATKPRTIEPITPNKPEALLPEDDAGYTQVVSKKQLKRQKAEAKKAQAKTPAQVPAQAKKVEKATVSILATAETKQREEAKAERAAKERAFALSLAEANAKLESEERDTSVTNPKNRARDKIAKEAQHKVAAPKNVVKETAVESKTLGPDSIDFVLPEAEVKVAKISPERVAAAAAKIPATVNNTSKRIEEREIKKLKVRIIQANGGDPIWKSVAATEIGMLRELIKAKRNAALEATVAPAVSVEQPEVKVKVKHPSRSANEKRVEARNKKKEKIAAKAAERNKQIAPEVNQTHVVENGKSYSVNPTRNSFTSFTFEELLAK